MWVFDTSQENFKTVMIDYQEICMKFLWENSEEGIKSSDAWRYVNKILKEENKSISRAAIINFLNVMVDKNLLTFIERSGKGGYHRVYFPAFDEGGLKRAIADEMISKLLEIWPEETRSVLEEKLS